MQCSQLTRRAGDQFEDYRETEQNPRVIGGEQDSMHCLCRCSRKEECASWSLAHAKPHGWLAEGRRRLSRELSLPEEISHSQNSFCDPRTKTRNMTAGIHRKYVAVQDRSVIERSEEHTSELQSRQYL